VMIRARTMAYSVEVGPSSPLKNSATAQRRRDHI
jgi:hypothetical protein